MTDLLIDSNVSCRSYILSLPIINKECIRVTSRVEILSGKVLAYPNSTSVLIRHTELILHKDNLDLHQSHEISKSELMLEMSQHEKAEVQKLFDLLRVGFVHSNMSRHCIQ
jgi:hypothetical protein